MISRDAVVDGVVDDWVDALDPPLVEDEPPEGAVADGLEAEGAVALSEGFVEGVVVVDGLVAAGGMDGAGVGAV